MANGFLPISKEDMKEQNIEQLDFVYVVGEAYVDHPSFGHAIISRVLENAGYTVGIISLPDWQTKEDFMRLGKPRLAFLCSAGLTLTVIKGAILFKGLRFGIVTPSAF